MFYICGMIKANELRIGNLVMAKSWRSEGLYLTKVDTISKHDYGREYRINHQFWESGYEWGASIEKGEVEPIPLTEEWLLKFGFEDGYSIYIENIGTLTVQPLLSEASCICELLDCEGTDVVYLGKLKHVHQLQNLYFALTGEELIYSNDTTKSPVSGSSK